MSDSSTFVPVGILFFHFNHLDLTLLDCSIYTQFCGRNCYKLEFRVENHKNGYPFLTKYINTRTNVKDFSFMVGKKFTKNDWNPYY